MTLAESIKDRAQRLTTWPVRMQLPVPGDAQTVIDTGGGVDRLLAGDDAVHIVPRPKSLLGGKAYWHVNPLQHLMGGIEGKRVLDVGCGVAQVRNSVNGAGDAVAQTMATITIPANSLGANGAFRISATWSCTNSANVKNVLARFGGTIINNVTMTNLAQLAYSRTVQNRNATNSQLTSFVTTSGNSFTSTTAAISTAAIDTTSAQDIILTCVWAGATASENITLEGYLVEVCNIP